VLPHSATALIDRSPPSAGGTAE